MIMSSKNDYDIKKIDYDYDAETETKNRGPKKAYENSKRVNMVIITSNVSRFYVWFTFFRSHSAT